MDKSWNFLVEAQDYELSSLSQLFLDSRFVVDNDANSMIKRMSNDLSINETENDYEQFIDIIGTLFSLSFPNNSLMEKETTILERFLFIIIDNLSIDELKSFAKCYRFSNIEKENLKKEISTRIVVSENFKLMLPFIVSNLSKSEETHMPSIVYGIPFSLMKSVLELPNTVISKSLTSNTLFRWIPIVATLIGMCQEYARPIEVDKAKDYLDTIIRFDSTFTSQKYSTLSVMLSLYKSLHDELELNSSLIEELQDFVHHKETAFGLHLFKKEELDKKDEPDKKKNLEDELMRFLMERLFPCDEKQISVYRENDRQSVGDWNTAFFYYRFPYTKISPKSLPNAKYVSPDDRLEIESIRLFFSSKNLDANYYLIERDELLRRIEEDASNWRIVVSYDDRFFYPKGAIIIRTNNAYEEIIESIIKNKEDSEISIIRDQVNSLNQFISGDKYDSIHRRELDQIDSISEPDKGTVQWILDLLIKSVTEPTNELLRKIINDDLFNELGHRGLEKKFKKLAVEVYHLKEDNMNLAPKEEGLKKKFRDFCHEVRPKIGNIRSKLNLIALNNYSMEDVQFAQTKLIELSETLQIVGGDVCPQAPVRLNLIGELKTQILGRSNDLFSIVEDFSEEDALWMDFGKLELGTVLDYVFDNIKRHGFPEFGRTYTQKEKIVRVSIEKQYGGFVEVSISNNGLRFEGGEGYIESVFEHGQSYGNSGNQGIGLYAVRENMRKYGGDAFFVSKPNEEFCVTILLKFRCFN